MKRIEIASNMFNNQEDASAQETGSNEDVQATA
jgi:hypothetical protein